MVLFISGKVLLLLSQRNDYRFLPSYSHTVITNNRPLIIGSGAVIGLEPASEYLFLIGVVPVGEYYKTGMVGVDALIMDGF